MQFDDIVAQKIRERLAGDYPYQRRLQEERDRNLAATEFFRFAVEKMLYDVAKNPVFEHIMHNADLSLEPEELPNGFGFQVNGDYANFAFHMDKCGDRFIFKIYPDFKDESLEFQGGYGDKNYVSVFMNLQLFVEKCREHIAGFLADVITTPAAEKIRLSDYGLGLQSVQTRAM